jgi:hypothetical protein
MRRACLPCLFLFGAAAAALALGAHQPLIRFAVERAGNASRPDLLRGSLRVGASHLDRRLRLELRGVHATLHAGARPVPVVAERIQSQGPVTAYLLGRPFVLQFEGVRGATSPQPGLRGVATIQRAPRWRAEVEAAVAGLDVGELAWLAPSHLSGSTGRLSGEVRLRLGAGIPSIMLIALRVPEPGGRVHSRFLELLAPYLPNAQEIRRAAAAQALVPYRTASLDVSLPAPDRLQVLLRLAMPEYNVNLNFNVEVRIDGQDLLQELGRLTRLLQTA